MVGALVVSKAQEINRLRGTGRSDLSWRETCAATLLM